ncbi:hypothetical protein NEILACOT_04529 [Neisseria lactamica ATCC 23970]|uniref:Uncharacterized protein n=1 Tax=Neisseria lactamica ATCC 23970 TaxID=546265 RepID=D0WAF9_NEILA|nr:hypothetical protein NEILACOT_04529 [Neisseria lactamica ATCC 23970]
MSDFPPQTAGFRMQRHFRDLTRGTASSSTAPHVVPRARLLPHKMTAAANGGVSTTGKEWR